MYIYHIYKELELMYVYKNVIFVITFFCIPSFFVVDGEDDFKTRRWKKNARCDRNACDCSEGCGYPTQCRRTEGFFSKFRCLRLCYIRTSLANILIVVTVTVTEIRVSSKRMLLLT
eukprot:UN04914